MRLDNEIGVLGKNGFGQSNGRCDAELLLLDDLWEHSPALLSSNLEVLSQNEPKLPQSDQPRKITTFTTHALNADQSALNPYVGVVSLTGAPTGLYVGTMRGECY